MKLPSDRADALHQQLKAHKLVVTAVVPQAVEKLSLCLGASQRVSCRSLLAIPFIPVTICVLRHEMLQMVAASGSVSHCMLTSWLQ